MHVRSQDGSWHNERRGGDQGAGWASAPGPCSERTGGRKTETRRRRKVSYPNKSWIQDSTESSLQTVFNKCNHLLIRVKEEQRRKQLAQQEQRQREAKAQQAKEKAKTEEELHQLKQEEDQHKKEEQEKELQAQMEKEVRVT